jgi:hypothetical protein
MDLINGEEAKPNNNNLLAQELNQKQAVAHKPERNGSEIFVSFMESVGGCRVVCGGVWGVWWGVGCGVGGVVW